MSREQDKAQETAQELERRTEQALNRIFELCDQRRLEMTKARLEARPRKPGETFWWEDDNAC